MNPKDARAQLASFVESLPDSVFSALLDKKLELNILPIDIAAKYELVLYETGNICEGVRRVLAGEDSPSNLVTFISQDKNIEEDNRAKIPAIAQELQKQIFDVALPVLKQAGMTVKEGRIAPAAQPMSPISPIGPIGQIRPIGQIGPIGQIRPIGQKASLEEKHLRALLRIAAGTNYTEERLREAFEDLPEGLRRAIVSVDTANAVQEIAKKFLLHVDQMGALASETGLVLLGLTHPRDFVKNLASRLRISEQRALEIAREVSGQILVKVREALRQLHESPTTPPRGLGTPPRAGGEGKTEPVRKLEVLSRQEEKILRPSGTSPPANRRAGFTKGGTTTPSVPSLSSTGGSALGGEKEGRLRTPYSPEARWNIGAEQGRTLKPEKGSTFGETSEESLTREEVLHGIENPQTAPHLKTANVELETRVGPTGWRPPAAADGGKSQFPISKSQTNSNAQIRKVPKQPPTSQQEHPPSLKTATPPLIGRIEEGSADLLEQKLAGPVARKPETRRYTIDPYREPTE